MDLGKAKLRKVGINNLLSGVHPQHGVIWTDGKGIFLAPIQVEGTNVQNATSVRLGEFEQVTSVHWSRCLSAESGAACHLCVVHQHTVTVWRVSGALPKLSFKQVRKINVRPIAQGCLWNPCNDVLCLLSRHQCSFYYRHDNNKSSYAFPALESGKISCGCWSLDGKKLVMCVGSTLLVYRWNDLTTTLDDFTAAAWVIPGLDGQVTSISPVVKDSVVVAAEVPLESLCKQQQDLFAVPEVNGIDATGDDGVLRPSKSPSATQSLLNLQQSSQAAADARSTLTLVNLQDGSRDPVKLSSAPLRGVLTPDILLYEKSSQCVVVGSNSQSQLHIYALLDKHLAYCGDIQLEKGQRPKGLCSMPTYFDDHGAALLILVGHRATEEASFLSSALEAEFQLSLKYIILKADNAASRNEGYEGRSKHNGHNEAVKVRTQGKSNTSISKSESMKEHRLKAPKSDAHLRSRSGSIKSDHQGAERVNSKEMEVRIPDATVTESLTDSQPLLTRVPTESSTKHHSKMIEDMSDTSDTPNAESLEVETSSFSDQRPSFHNSKLSNEFDLHPPSRSKSKAVKESKLSASQPSLFSPTDYVESVSLGSKSESKEQLTEVSQEKINNYKKTGILRVSPTRQTHQQATVGKYASPEEKVTTPVSEESQKDPQQPTHMADVTPSSHDHVSTQSTISEVIDISFVANKGLSQKDSNHEPLVQQLPCIAEVKSEAPEQTELAGRLDSTDGERVREETWSDRGLGSSLHSADSSFDSMEKQVRQQRETIEALQKRLEGLSVAVDQTSCVFPSRYQDMSQPEMIEIVCDKPEGTETKRFLLDNGRLQLEPVKLSFGLDTVELWLDGIPCVLGANIDGYIPMRFFPSTSLHISGLPAHRPTPADLS
ncbi:WD repeat and coiled-coil-containing protein [Aplysia californica]|uniref:WD repeat and coiled-coil-containing protein n=1 Tax=Aplysia californica TaxID=6500 RepID=A0ABM0ZV90_APLCA|nr:WD repeat and coiled-coil-containing protein [Aplysia californica]